MIARFFSFFVNAAFAAIVVGAAVPGMHRVVAPHYYGLSEIAPRVWSDTQRRGKVLNLASQARNQVNEFFGYASARPTLILCETKACAKAFGIRGNGLSLLDMAVMVSPGGLTLGTLTHEMTHSRLHLKTGIRNILSPTYPAWFDEGLATHVADHPIWNGQITRAHRDRVKQVKRAWQLRGAFRDLGVGRTYRAAAAEVADIEARIGRAGLLGLVTRAQSGEGFSAALADLMRR